MACAEFLAAGDLLRGLGGHSMSGQQCGKFTDFNRNKRDITLNLKTPEARELAKRGMKLGPFVLEAEFNKKTVVDFDDAANQAA